ncbi:MAG TPA: ABC transporter ATP-binding protein [Anaerolineales bacterium]|nr:ABC transporter ATP-binding protein [Anaerolineales bacterium]
MAAKPVLNLINIHKSYSSLPVLRGISFELQAGEVLGVLGPSGSGKSTLLMILAGLEKPERGEIRWNGELINETPPHRRGFGLMFQDYVLFPHMNVFANIAFGLRMAWLAPGEIKARVEEMLELVGLAGFEGRDVNTLSGGEQQRVALARALAPQPRLLMLDEPLGSVDRTLRERLMVDIREILRQMGQTAIYVTHDQEEAFALSDRIVLIRAGTVEQAGAPQEIYRRPASLFVARFLGLGNLINGEARPIEGRTVLHTRIGPFPSPTSTSGPVIVLLRPEAARLAPTGDFSIKGQVAEASFRGSQCRLVVAMEGERLTFDFPSNADLPAQGEPIELFFDRDEAIQVFDGVGG